MTTYFTILLKINFLSSSKSSIDNYIYKSSSQTFHCAFGRFCSPTRIMLSNASSSLLAAVDKSQLSL